ncbi:hypothetical protein Bbelb_317450 [Branchiostoma belcheri]|nr:hypothetical protein Bbelb_317450 [Branchiostoma belcheri]
MVIIKHVQNRYYKQEIQTLKGQGFVKAGSTILQLNPKLDVDGMLRVGGRLSQSTLSEEAKNPMLLPKSSSVAELVVREIHENHGHMGRNYVTAKVRERYWIPQSSTLIRKIISRCVTCRRHHGKTGEQKMADLPSHRVTPDEYPVLRAHHSQSLTEAPGRHWLEQIYQAEANLNMNIMESSRVGLEIDYLSFDHTFKNLKRHIESDCLSSIPVGAGTSRNERCQELAALQKAAADGQDPWTAILAWRNTPTQGQDSSPAQRLMSRRTRTPVPIRTQALEPKVVQGVHNSIIEIKARAKRRYDEGARSLPPLQPGQQVRVELAPNRKEAEWTCGTLVQRVAPRPYEVEVDGAKYRRN